MFANTDLLAECRLSLVVAKWNGHEFMLDDVFEVHLAPFSIGCYESDHFDNVLRALGRLNDFKLKGKCIGLILLNGCFQIQVMVTVWRLTQTFVHEDFHMCLSKVFCNTQIF